MKTKYLQCYTINGTSFKNSLSPQRREGAEGAEFLEALKNEEGLDNFYSSGQISANFAS